MSVVLSVNLNKVATLRNARTSQSGDISRGFPSVVEAARVCIAAGAKGITVHPRPDARHITAADVRELRAVVAEHRGIEFNIEGDPRPDLIELVDELAPEQFTLVPVRPGELTSEAGWPADTPIGPLRALVERMQARKVRVSVFVNPDPAQVRWAAALGAERIELFTEPFAAAYARDSAGQGRDSFATYVAAAEVATELGLGINAGHDLDESNLGLFRALPGLCEVSIGHALIGQSVFDGLSAVVARYLEVLSPRAPR